MNIFIAIKFTHSPVAALTTIIYRRVGGFGTCSYGILTNTRGTRQSWYRYMSTYVLTRMPCGRECGLWGTGFNDVTFSVHLSVWRRTGSSRLR